MLGAAREPARSPMFRDPTHRPPDDAALLDACVRETRAWVVRAIVGLGLCPFAKAPHAKGRIRYAASDARSTRRLLDAFTGELDRLVATAEEAIETTLLIHPFVLNDFVAFNRFLSVAQQRITDAGLDGVVQLASFHPDYRFADADAGPVDVDNATNRSPYPTLHLLRESSVDRAVAAFPEADAIFTVNVATMRRLGDAGWGALQAACRADAVDDPS